MMLPSARLLAILAALFAAALGASVLGYALAWFAAAGRCS